MTLPPTPPARLIADGVVAGHPDRASVGEVAGDRAGSFDEDAGRVVTLDGDRPVLSIVMAPVSAPAHHIDADPVGSGGERAAGDAGRCCPQSGGVSASADESTLGCPHCRCVPPSTRMPAELLTSVLVTWRAAIDR